MKISIFLFVPFTFLFALPLAGQPASSDKKIEDLIGKMTLEEKIDFIGGYQDFHIRSVPRLGIPQTNMADGPVGVRNYGPSTAYPATINLTASWDTMLARRVGDAIGKESRARNNHFMLCPAMNIHRAPMNGRNFEYLGEDPFLAGKIAVQIIQGIQQEGVMATAKHYMGNFQEYNRHRISTDMDERTMREIYLPAFQASVIEGHTAAVMTSYNLVNGIHASQHDYLINKILKDEWKFDGIVMSDWTSVYDGVAAANGGLDLEMPSGKWMCRDTLLPALKDGRLSEKTIDDKIRRILREYERFGYFENPDISKGFVLDSNDVRATSLDDARGGIVLLKNEKNILPLQSNSIKRIALIGPNGDPAVTGGGGSALVQPLHPLSLYEALQRIAPKDISVTFESGIYETDLPPVEFYAQSKFYSMTDGKKIPGLNIEYFAKRWPEGKPDQKQHVDNSNLVFNNIPDGISKDNFSAQCSGLLQVEESGKYRFVVSSDVGFRLFVNDSVIVGSWSNVKEAVHSATVQLEAGKENKISLHTWQRHANGIVRLGYETEKSAKQKTAERYRQAYKLAEQSDLVILSVGFNNETERENADRTFALPMQQQELIQEVMKAKKDIIVVLNAGGNVDMNQWLLQTKALIHAWYPGQEGNLAVAEILFGKTNPSGKLPVSFEKRWEDNATYNSYYDDDGDKHVKFTEGVFLGYRHFDKDNIDPQFPFGFGLSYTTFEYSNLIANKDQYKITDPVEITLTVKNTGKVDGAEVVELYVNDPVASLPRPPKELKAFSKVQLKAGESKEVKFTLNENAFHFYNPDKKQWVIEPGEFNILIGSSSKDIRVKKNIIILE
ncbi:MAG: glycoside hydrolase family 3 C-terminal domain-containing protein [Ignavibacteriales bacterium]|nr:glycoside hydrolase family 3 C-terminal domain-containing protein [Ignavibacteriales bacterium]